MNRKQRNKNRKNFEWLKDQQRCPECGERGRHYVVVPQTLFEIISGGRIGSGFWTCSKFYGPDGKRINQ